MVATSFGLRPKPTVGVAQSFLSDPLCSVLLLVAGMAASSQAQFVEPAGVQQPQQPRSTPASAEPPLPPPPQALGVGNPLPPPSCRSPMLLSQSSQGRCTASAVLPGPPCGLHPGENGFWHALHCPVCSAAARRPQSERSKKPRVDAGGATGESSAPEQITHVRVGAVTHALHPSALLCQRLALRAVGENLLQSRGLICMFCGSGKPRQPCGVPS